MSQQYSDGGNNYEFSPPRPYVWKTDEFQVSESKARKNQQINQVQPLGGPLAANQPPRPQPLAYRQPNNLSENYRCPRCASQLYPVYERRISQAGWITFAVLLVAFFPLFWIGLLIKEDVRVCPICKLAIT